MIYQYREPSFEREMSIEACKYAEKYLVHQFECVKKNLNLNAKNDLNQDTVWDRLK